MPQMIKLCMYCRHLTLTERLAAKCTGPVMKTLPQAAATTIYAAVSPDLLDKSGTAYHRKRSYTLCKYCKDGLFVYNVVLQHSWSYLSLCQALVLFVPLIQGPRSPAGISQVHLLMCIICVLYCLLACLSLCVSVHNRAATVVMPASLTRQVWLSRANIALSFSSWCQCAICKSTSDTPHKIDLLQVRIW